MGAHIPLDVREYPAKGYRGDRVLGHGATPAAYRGRPVPRSGQLPLERVEPVRRGYAGEVGVYGPTGLLRELYPTTSRFYELLFQERLGFRLAHWEGTDMEVLGLRLVENPFARPGLPVPAAIASTWERAGAFVLPGADESWTVYDRPLVMVFRNEGRLSAQEIQSVLLAGEP